MKLDTNLLNRDLFRQAAFQHFVLETLNINFKQVDGIMPIHLHFTRNAGAGQALAAAGL